MQVFVYTIGTVLGLWIIYHTIRLIILGSLTVVYGKQTNRYSQTPEEPNLSILVMGDSTAYGVGAKEPQNSLVGRLALDLPKAQIKNAAENAINTKRLHELMLLAPTQSFDYVMIHIGGIDTISCRSESQIKNALSEALAEAKRVATKKVFVISVNNAGLVPFFPYPLNQFFSWRSKNVSELTARVCTEAGCIHIPLYTERSGDEFSNEPERYISTDQIHPNDAGYGLWYKKIRSVVLPIIR